MSWYVCACVRVCVFVSGSMCAVLWSCLLYLHVWSEHLSSSSRRCKTVRQAAARHRSRERDSRHFKPLLLRYQTFPKFLRLGENTLYAHTCTDAVLHHFFPFSCCCIFHNHSIYHKQAVSQKEENSPHLKTPQTLFSTK